MIEFVSVTKAYDDFIALDNIDLSIRPEDFLFLTGHSGSGKTTLIKMIIREILPTNGQVIIEDEDITRLKRQNIYNLRRKIGVIFQDFKLIADKTAYENVSFAMEASGRTDKEIKEIVPYVLDIVNLSDKMKSFPEQLSGGQKQKVAIARAIANDPKILIADEPTGNLDEEATWDILEILKKINQWGTTVIMSTHSAEILRSQDERMVTLEKGALIADTHSTKTKSNKEFSEKLLEEDEKPQKIKAKTKKDKKKKGVKKSKKIEKRTKEPEKNTDDKTIETEMPKTEIETEKTNTNINQDKPSTEPEENTKESKTKETEERKKPKIKISLAKKKEDIKTEQEEKDTSTSSVQEDKRLSEKEIPTIQSGELEDYNMSKGTIKLLKKNKYKNIQDILSEGIEKIKNIDGIDGNHIMEIEKALEEFLS